MSEQVCYTFEAALEMAIKMEDHGFRCYLKSIRMLKSKAAKEILRDSALDELQHKQDLEKALLLGQMDGDEEMTKPVPTMNLGYILPKKELCPDSDTREALAFAIHLEKEAIDFYKMMTAGCAGAPNASLFQRLLADESRHLQNLEDLYEQHFMTEN